MNDNNYLNEGEEGDDNPPPQQNDYRLKKDLTNSQE